MAILSATDLPNPTGVSWTDALSAVATAAAAIGTLITLIVIALQLRRQSQALEHQRVSSAASLTALTNQIEDQKIQTGIANVQMRLQTEQSAFIAERTRLLRKQSETETSAAELNYNLEVMKRLQDVLWEICDDEPTWQHVWGTDTGRTEIGDCRRPQLGVWALTDIISLALAACDRLPQFSRNQLDWIQYALDTIHQSSKIREELLGTSGKIYWPEVYPLARAYVDGGIRDAKVYLQEKSQWELTLER